MASAQLSIPHRYRSGAESIALLSPPVADAIRQFLAIDEAALDLKPKRSAPKGLKNVSASDLERIFVTLKSLYAARENGRQSVEKFARDVVKDIRRKKPEMFPSAEGWAGAIRNFELLLSIDTLEIAQKERHIRRADEKRFCGAEVLVDMRPVFSGESGDELRRLLIAYRLRLGFHAQGGEHEDLYISLDLDDIQALRESLNQAELQGDVLQKQAKNLLRLGGK